MPKKAKKFKQLNFITQNARGIKTTERVYELSTQIKRQDTFALCLQETWKSGKSVEIVNDCTFLLNGLDASDNKSKRGQGGVGIVLNKSATQAWKEAGSPIYTEFGNRIIATRLSLKDNRNKNIDIFLVSAYAPIGVADALLWDTFLQNLENCMNSKRPKDILIVGCDTNSSLGISYERSGSGIEMSSVGKFGLPHSNYAGTRLTTFLEINRLVACSTYFRKKNYATWRHPRSKLPHQIDHLLVLKTDFRRVVDVFASKPLLDSDHLSVRLKLRIAARFIKKSPTKRPLSNLDSNKLLLDRELRGTFVDSLSSKLQALDRVEYESFEKSLHDTASSVLPKITRQPPDWFSANESELLNLIEKRNFAVYNKTKRITRRTTAAAIRARKELKNAINVAKSTWIMNSCNRLNKGPNALNLGTKSFWESVKLLKNGLSKPPPPKQVMMKKEDGSKCVSSEENAEVFRIHFSKLYNREESYDPSILSSITPCLLDDDFSQTPNVDEIRKAVLRLKNKAPGASGLTAPMFKSLTEDELCFDYFVKIIVDIWENETYPSQWDLGKLVILPKKGDLSKPGNYRGIMLLETAYKVLAIIIHNRLQPFVENLDHEAQCGFRQGRGCMDAVFSIKLALKKRREHNLETWVLFLDLVKAFDRVPRSLLWQVLQKFGLSDKLISILKVLHVNFKVNFQVDSVDNTMPCTIGVKQGDILGPVLFVIYIAAIMQTWRKIHDRPLCMYRTKEDFTLTGRRYNTKGSDFSVDDSEYADDTAVLFESRSDTETYSPLLITHFFKFGMEIHVGDIRTPEKPSKTEILFVSKPPKSYSDPATYDGIDLSPIKLCAHTYFPIVDKFCYLGCFITRDCKDYVDITNRIKKASNAFGALRTSIFASRVISDEAKSAVYISLILPILLYGAETWSLTEHLLRLLRNFHHACIRSMCRINRSHVFLYRISTESLLIRLNIQQIEFYIFNRQLSWLGHVSRMSFDRLPRKLLSCWVCNARLRGSPEFTYGRSVYKALKWFDIEKSTWFELTHDRGNWRKLINV